MIQWPYHGDINEKWTLTNVSGGYYKIISLNSSKAAVVQYGATTDGAAIIQYTYSGTNNELWRLVDIGGGYYKIINKNSGKALCVQNASTADGAVILQKTQHIIHHKDFL